MKFRTTEIISNEAADTAATRKEKIQTSDIITGLHVRMKGVNNGSTPTAHPCKMLPNIAVKDGSHVLYSLSAAQIQAINFLTGNKPNFNTLEYRNDVQCIITADLLFGRWLGDPNYGLDPNRFDNLAIEIQHNKALGGSAPDAGYLECVATCFRGEQPNITGRLETQEIKDYSLVSSAWEYTDLEVGPKYRQIMPISLSGGKAPHDQFNKVKLNEDNGKSIPLDDSTSDLIKYLNGKFGRWEEHIIGQGTTGAVTTYCTPTYENGVLTTALDATAAYFATSQSYGGTFSPIGNAAVAYCAYASGHAPHGGVGLLSGNVMDPEDWYDTNGLSNLKLSLYGGSSVGSSSKCQIVTQVLRDY